LEVDIMNPGTRSLYHPILRFLSVACLTALVGCGGGHFSGPSGADAISLSAPTTTLDAGAETQVSAEVTDFAGRLLPNATVTWEVSDPEMATVTASGQSAKIVAGQKGGTVTVTARSGAKTAQFDLTVKGAQPVAISFSKDIQPIFNRSCALPDCHAGPEELAGEGMVLAEGVSYNHIVKVPANQVFETTVNRIEPGDPDHSYLVAKLLGTHRDLGGSGSKMPLDGTLPDADLQKIIQWVKDGALNN
jgi:hypothetical protein